MVNVLYAVTAFTCALIAFILPMKVAGELKKGTKVERNFLRLIRWNGFFCLVDALWGISASELVMNDGLLFALSFAFHSLAALTPAFWLNFVLTYLGDIRGRRAYQWGTLFIITVEIALLIANFGTGFLFYVDGDGVYCSTPWRKMLFYMQYATYFAIAILSIVNHIREKVAGKEEHDHTAVLAFVASPIFCGVFQMIYPDAPAYSIGYTLGVSVIYAFVITDLLQRRYIESAKAEAASDAKTKFLFNMSHDIRTPMNAIIGFTNIGIAHYDEPERALDSFEKIRTSGNHLLSLINDILEMSRIEAGRLELSEEPVDLKKLAKGVAEMNNSLALSKSIDFIVKYEDIPCPYVYADELHLTEVLVNLLSNALKYTERGGKIWFTVSGEQASPDGKALAVFSVKDTGIGISEEFQKHLFESFSREEGAAVSKQQGTGLGLSIVKRIVDLSGGTIDVKSKPGAGSVFTVRIPFDVMDEKAIAEFTEKREIAYVEESASFAGCRVLLTEDNELNREIATDILTEAGLLVDTAQDGQIAVDRIEEKGTGYYDYILMDIQMPVMNGYEAAEKIRSLPEGDQIPIIALSANAFSEDIKKSMDAGMDAHVPKPIDIALLFRTMESLKDKRIR